MCESLTTFYSPLEYSINGSRHTVLCEGTWTTDLDDGNVTRLRIDSEQFPAFWVAGTLVGDVLEIDGGRFDDTWTSSPVRHTEFVCTSGDGTFVISHGEVELVIPRPGSRTIMAFGVESETIHFPTSFGSGLVLQRR